MSRYDDGPSSNREAMADEAGVPERDEEYIRQTYKEKNVTDPTETARREMIETSQPAADLAGDSGPSWTTEELTRDFEVIGFMAPFVVVRRRSDGVKGSMEFCHSPRVYFGFTAD